MRQCILFEDFWWVYSNYAWIPTSREPKGNFLGFEPNLVIEHQNGFRMGSKSMFSINYKLYISGKLLQFVGELCKKNVFLEPNLVVGTRQIL